MLSCRDVCEKAQDYTDGNGAFWTRLKIRFHLMMCKNCTNFVDQTRKTKALISQSLNRDEKAQISPELIAAFQKVEKETQAVNNAPSEALKRRLSDDT